MKLVVQPIQRGCERRPLHRFRVVLALAEASPAKIETQHGKTETVQRLHGMKDDFIVQRAAIDGMGMAHHGSVSGIGNSSIEQGLETAGMGPSRNRERIVPACVSIAVQ